MVVVVKSVQKTVVLLSGKSLCNFATHVFKVDEISFTLKTKGLICWKPFSIIDARKRLYINDTLNSFERVECHVCHSYEGLDLTTLFKILKVQVNILVL